MKLTQKIALRYIRTKFKMLALVSKRLTAEKAFDLFCTPYPKSSLRTPSIFELAEHLSFNLNGIKIRGFRWNVNQPKKVLILHGFGSAAHKFHAYISPLITKGYEVLAFDAPAHGNSEGTRTNAMQYCEMIDEVIKLYGPINSFIAHSFGGMAVSLAIEKIPDNTHLKIVLIAPATETASAVEAAFKMLHLKDNEVKLQFNNIILEKSGHQTEWFSINRAMQNISASVLWIHDEGDDITPYEDVVPIKNKNLPNIRFIITKGLGHKKIYNEVTIRKEVINFL